MNSIGSIDSSVSTIMASQSRPTGRPPGPPPGFDEALESAAEQVGLDPTEIADLRTQIEDAISGARESGEGREAVKAAVDSVLEDNGIDVSAFKAQLEAVREKMGTPPARSPSDQSYAEGLAESNDESLSILSMLQDLPAGSLLNTDA